MIRLLFTFFVISLFTSCSTSKNKADQLNNFIQFGKYGGFAGSHAEYKIFESGKAMHRTNPKGRFLTIESIDKDAAARIFSNYESLKIGTMIMEDPGNLTKFIVASVNGKVHRQEWGAKLKPLDDSLRLYFQALNKLIENKHAIQ